MKSSIEPFKSIFFFQGYTTSKQLPPKELDEFSFFILSSLFEIIQKDPNHTKQGQCRLHEQLGILIGHLYINPWGCTPAYDQGTN